jgi:hypothetical protein
MATTQQSDPGKEMGGNQRDTLNALIGKHVVRSLGSPSDLLKVQVRPLGNDRYRVNVLVGKDASSGRIAHSFFLTTDSEGNIITSSPEIVKLF